MSNQTNGDTPELRAWIATASIFELLPLVAESVGAVGKTRKNEQQNYSFRGIDDFMDACHPALVKWGVTVIPEVIKHNMTVRDRVKNGEVVGVTVHVAETVRYTFYAPNGSHVSALMVGEAADTADKATNKAHSAAFKYALQEVFCIPLADTADGDRVTPVMAGVEDDKWLDSAPRDMPSGTDIEEFVNRINAVVDPATRAKLKQGVTTRFGLPGGLDRPTLAQAYAWVDEQLAAVADPAAPVSEPEPSGGDRPAEPVAPVSDDSRRLSGPPIPTVQATHAEYDPASGAGTVEGNTGPTAQPAYGGDAEVGPTELLGEQTPRLTAEQAVEVADYGDRIVRYVDLLPKPTLVEMATARGLPSGDKIDVLRARISVALVTERHPAPADDVLAKLEVAASRTRSTSTARR